MNPLLTPFEAFLDGVAKVAEEFVVLVINEHLRDYRQFWTDIDTLQRWHDEVNPKIHALEKRVAELEGDSFK